MAPVPPDRPTVLPAKPPPLIPMVQPPPPAEPMVPRTVTVETETWFSLALWNFNLLGLSCFEVVIYQSNQN
eukprot:Skav229364  [mRNA]  locus=scaffold3853:22391:22603:- [translate_table: standard]